MTPSTIAHKELKKGQQHFRTNLDPGLLLQSSPAGPSRGQRATSLGLDRANFRGVNREGGGRNVDKISNTRRRRPLSRINSLTMSTDSPKYIRPRPPTMQEDSGTTTTTTHSTIGSFGESRSGIVSLREALTAERNEELKHGKDERKKNLIKEMDSRTMYGSKRRRLEREAMNAVRTSNPVPPILSSSSPMQPSDNSASADALWKNIWARWDEGRAAGGEDDVMAVHPSPLPDFATTPLEEPILSSPLAKIPEEEVLSQQSHLSTQSENGQFQSQFSFYRFDAESGNVGGSSIERSMKNSAVLEHAPYEINATSSFIEEWEDTSRSRIDARLLIDDVSEEGQVEERKLAASIQERVDLLCRECEVEMEPVAHVIFRGDDVQEYFGPTWDGFRLQKPPPSRVEMLEWGMDKSAEEGEGELYDYGDNLEAVTHWQE